MGSTLLGRIVIAICYTHGLKSVSCFKTQFCYFQLLAVGSCVTYLLWYHCFGHGVKVTAGRPKATINVSKKYHTNINSLTNIWRGTSLADFRPDQAAAFSFGVGVEQVPSCCVLWHKNVFVPDPDWIFTVMELLEDWPNVSDWGVLASVNLQSCNHLW